MRTKSLVLIIIALGCGLVASIGISEVLKQKPVGDAIEMDSILVAAMDIDIGKKLDAENVKMEQWPKGKVPEGAIHTMEELSDRYTRSRLFSGEPILTAKLMENNDNNANIPDGYRVIPVRVELDTVIGLIQPGDLVDVMVFLRQGPDIPRTGTYTILRMVRVYAVNTQTDRATDAKGQDSAAKTVSLLVKPKQGERLTLATELGKLRLALRRPTDDIPDDEEVEKDLPAIFQGADMIAVDKPEVSQSPAPAPVTVDPIVQAVPVAIPQVELPAPVWKMQIHSPGGVQHFDWMDEKALPQESSVSSPSVAPTTIPETPIAEQPASEASSGSEETVEAESAE